MEMESEYKPSEVFFFVIERVYSPLFGKVRSHTTFGKSPIQEQKYLQNVAFFCLEDNLF